MWVTSSWSAMWETKWELSSNGRTDHQPNDNTRIDDQELEELRDLGVGIPQRVNRAETVRKAIQRHIDKLESS